MERNLYSASQFGRRILCPGSAKAEAGLPEISSPDAESGTRVHRAALLGDETGCTEEEIALARRWRDANPPPPDAEVLTEWRSVLPERFWNDYGFTADTAPNGTIDRVILYRSQVCALIQDLKSGWHPPSETVLAAQMGVYAVLLFCEFNWIVKVRIEVPYLRTGKSFSRTIHRGEISSELQTISSLIHDCEQRSLVISPSEAACRHCRAAPTCPGPRSMGRELIQVEHVERLPAAQLNHLYSLVPTVERQAEAVRKAMRAAIEAGAEGLDYEIIEKPGNREPSSLTNLYSLLRTRLTDAECLALMSISIPDAEKAWKVAAKKAGVGPEEARETWIVYERSCVQRGAPRKHIVKKTEGA